MKINIKFSSTNPPSTGGIFRAKKYGDPFMVAKMGLDTEAMGTSNFQNIDLFTPQDGFKGVSVFQRLGKSELDYLMRIQPTDAGSFNSKMTFLCSDSTPPGRPYWTRGGTWGQMASGEVATDLRFGTLIFGGQLVKVETDVSGLPIIHTFITRYQSEADSDMRPIQFYKLEGMRREDVGRYTHASHPWFIQRCTWATYPDNQYRDTWSSGIVYHPVWSPLDYPVSNGASSLYIACDFVTRDN